jgi:hypothetical protein
VTKRVKAVEPKKITAVKIHKLNKDWDDGDPLYEVTATLTFADGSKQKYEFDWVRAGHLYGLRHPRTRDEDILEDLQYLVETGRKVK